MDEQFMVECSYCGEAVEVYVEPGVRGSFIRDSEVCVGRWRIQVHDDDGDRSLSVTRADDSE